MNVEDVLNSDLLHLPYGIALKRTEDSRIDGKPEIYFEVKIMLGHNVDMYVM